MYAHIDGVVSEKNVDSLVLDCGGVGYLLQVSRNTLAAAPGVGQRMKCYTILNVREDAMELFGFATREEKGMYEKLRGVSGIGPRNALSILSTLTARDLSIALVTGDAAMLARAPGIGKKTAQRLVLELRDKIDNDQLTGSALPAGEGAARGISADAIEALMALGYQSTEAARAVAQASAHAEKLDDLIRLALKSMG